MEKILKKISKIFIVLKQKEEKDIRQSILLVDGNFILPNNFVLILKDVKEKFQNAKIAVLTFEDKKEFLRDIFPDIEIVAPDPKIGIGRPRFYIQLLRLLRKNYKFIILASLDIIPAGLCLFFSDSTIFLHNKWLEWYQLRAKNITDIFRRTKSTDKNRRKRNNGIIDILKSFGRKFIILQDIDKVKIKTNILITDNGYTPIDHVLTAVRRAEATFINPDITILTFMMRKGNFNNIFPHLKVVIASNLISSRKLAWQIYRLRKYRFDYIVLTTLDILPVMVALGFTIAKTLLYNKWQQWWSLEFKNIKGCSKDLMKIILAVPLVIYLLIVSGIILLRTFLRAWFINLNTTHLEKQT